MFKKKQTFQSARERSRSTKKAVSKKKPKIVFSRNPVPLKDWLKGKNSPSD